MLREIYNPPFVLYKKGAKINHEIPSIAVVGTRKATVVASTAAYNLGLEMADGPPGKVVKFGFVVILGIGDRLREGGIHRRNGHAINKRLFL